MSHKFTVFYAWQSDRSQTICKTLIRTAAADALKRLQEEQALDRGSDVEDAPDIEYELDHDTAGVAGSPKVAETIFKKIDTCDVFLADLTIVTSYENDASTKRRKHAPNANVLIEHGYARKSKGEGRIVCVQNTAFGDGEMLPFDLKHLRHPISYSVALGDAKARQQAHVMLTGVLFDAFKTVLKELQAEREGAAVVEHQRVLKRIETAEQLRSLFETKVVDGHFHRFKTERGILALSLYPIDKPGRLDFDTPHASKVLRDFRPIRSDSFARESFGRSRVVHQTFDTVNNIPFAVTEFKDDGSVSAVENWMRFDDGEPREVKCRMNVYEPALIEAIFEYLNMMRSFGITGPIVFGMSMFKIKGFKWLWTDDSNDYARLRGFLDDEYRAESVIIQPSNDTSSREAVAKVIAYALDEFWRESGQQRDPLFNSGTREYEGFKNRPVG